MARRRSAPHAEARRIDRIEQAGLHRRRRPGDRRGEDLRAECRPGDPARAERREDVQAGLTRDEAGLIVRVSTRRRAAIRRRRSSQRWHGNRADQRQPVAARPAPRRPALQGSRIASDAPTAGRVAPAARGCGDGRRRGRRSRDRRVARSRRRRGGPRSPATHSRRRRAATRGRGQRTASDGSSQLSWPRTASSGQSAAEQAQRVTPRSPAPASARCR